MTDNISSSQDRTVRLQPLLTVEDLEQLLRVHRRTIARMCKRGELPRPLKIGGGNRWRVEAIEEALDRLSDAKGRN